MIPPYLNPDGTLTSTHTFILYLAGEEDGGEQGDDREQHQREDDGKQAEDDGELADQHYGADKQHQNREQRPLWTETTLREQPLPFEEVRGFRVSPGSTLLLDRTCNPTKILRQIVPRTNRLLLFPHGCPHEGRPVCKGGKLLIRGECFVW